MFSIIIPTYNRADFIEKTINSVLNQTHKDFEIIVVDDGSTDNTREIVTDIKDERIHYYKKENEERAVARNFGARKAKGEYVNFLDSDDVALNNHLSTAFEFIENHNKPEIFHLGYNWAKPDGSLITSVNNLKGDINTQLLKGNIFSCNGVFIRKDIIDKYPFNEDRDLSASEDWELWLRLAARYKIKYSNIITSVIIDHEDRSVRTINKEKLIKRKELFIYYLSQDKVFMEKYGKYLPRLKADSYSYIALHLILAGYKKDAIKYLIKSILKSPRVIIKKRFFAIVKRIFV